MRIVSYNIACPVDEPIRFSGQDIRMNLMPNRLLHELGPIDIIILYEAIVPRIYDALLDRFKVLGFMYHTELLSSHTRLVRGGIVILSKHPIISQNLHAFTTLGCASDALSGKGAVAARIHNGHTVFTIIGTHLQSLKTDEARRVRVQQAHEVANLVKTLPLDPHETVIICGDWNIDRYTEELELNLIASELGDFDVVGMASNSHPYSYDPLTNPLVGTDNPEEYSNKYYPQGCYEELLDTGVCFCCTPELIDMAMVKKSNPAKSISSRIFPLKHSTSFRANLNSHTVRDITDFSDHYPLIVDFEPMEVDDELQQRLSAGLKSVRNIGWWSPLLVLVAVSIVVFMFFVYPWRARYLGP